jgi:hypothetical protein
MKQKINYKYLKRVFPNLLSTTCYLLFLTYNLLPSTSTSQITFERTYGSTGNDIGRYVQQTLDGGYIIAGGGLNVYLVKTDSLGDTLWTRNHACDGDYCWGNSVQQTMDGGYIIVVLEDYWIEPDSSDIYLIKTDSMGNIIWSQTYGENLLDMGYSVQQTSDGGYIIVGYTDTGPGYLNTYLIKTNTLGDTLWTKIHGETFTGGYSVQQTLEGGYIIAGFINPIGSNWHDVYLIKTDSLGETLWTQSYGENSNNDIGMSVQQTSDGGYIIAGSTSFAMGLTDNFIIKTDSLGDTLWTKVYGGTDWEYAYSVKQTSDGGFIIAGFTDSFGAGGTDVYLIKTDSLGDTLWTRTFGGSSVEYSYSVQQTRDGGFIIVGRTNSFGPGDMVYLIKTDGNGMVVGVEEEPGSGGFRNVEFRLFQNYPNPFNKLTAISYQIPSSNPASSISPASPSGGHHVSLNIYDITGRLVEVLVNKHQKPGIYQIHWDGRIPDSGVRSGIYFYRLQSGNYTNTKKLILLK